MSRIGKKPVALPKGVTASVEGQTVKVKGPKGELSVKLVPQVSASVDEHGITVTPDKAQEKSAQMWGLSRSLVNNLVTGVTTGFTQKLEIQGVGYRAAVQGKVLNLQLGFSHDVPYAIPAGITIVTEKPTMHRRFRASTSSWSDRSPPKSAAGVRRSPIRARACAMKANMSAAKKARRSKNDKRSLQKAPVAHPLPDRQPRHPAPSVGVPFGQAHLCPGDRRHHRPSTLASASTAEKEGKGNGYNVESASNVGKKIAERALAKGVKQVMFDRGGYIYHGRVKALADAAREGGLEF